MDLIEPSTLPAQQAKSRACIPLLLTLLALLTATLLRTVHIGRESLWFDEGYTAWMVSHSPHEIIRLILADTAPPLYYLLIHFWTQLFGNSEAALRSLSSVFSLLTFLVALSIAKRILKNPPAVAAAAWLMALSFLQTWYAREARAYALMGLLGVASFDVLQRHLASNHRRWLLPQALLIAASMYTHNMMAPYALATMLTWLILPSEHTCKRRLIEITMVTTASIILYLPWALIGLPAQLAMIRQAFWVEPLKHGIFFDAIASLVGVKHYWTWTHLLDRIHLPLGEDTRPIFITLTLMLASAFLSIFRQKADRRREALGLLTMALAPLLLVAAYSILRTPLFTAKLFQPSTTLMSIFILIPLGMPLSKIAKRIAWTCAAMLIALSALTLFSHNLEDPKENWRAAARIVSNLPPQNRLIIFVANDGQLPFDYYYHYLPTDDRTATPAGFFALNPPRTMRQVFTENDLTPLKQKLATHPYDQIVLVLAHQFWGDPHHLTQTFIAQHYLLAGSENLPDIKIQWYTFPH